MYRFATGVSDAVDGRRREDREGVETGMRVTVVVLRMPGDVVVVDDDDDVATVAQAGCLPGGGVAEHCMQKTGVVFTESVMYNVLEITNEA